ncbi:MAG: AAA family ATPase [Bacteroidia bacterium]|nr:AAA family ATPase [Bacteroidia bacterium]
MKLVGRQIEKNIMAKLLTDDESNFLAVYGRRRIGKTYLIREFYQKHIVFEASSLHEKDKTQQLENFWLSINEFNKTKREKPQTWLMAFQYLKEYILSIKGKQKKVIFLDEIAWFETQKS